MRWKVVVLVLALILAMAVPTAAVTGSEDATEGVTMAPHDGPNGQYAAVTDGDVEISFDRLNDGATTTADDVFNVTNDGDTPREVWVEIDDATAYRHDDPADRVDSAADAVVLTPGETLQVGFAFDTADAAPEPDSMTVHANGTTEADDGDDATETPTEPGGEAEFRTDVSVDNGSSPTEKRITLAVSNDGNASGTYTASPTVDGEPIGSQTVTVAPGETREVTFTHRFDEPGTHRIEIGGMVRTITVAAAVDARFVVTALSAADGEVTAGNATTVTATVENRGTAEGTYTAVLLDDGEVIAEQTVTVPAGERRAVTFTPTFDAVGDHELSVGEGTATVTVVAAGDLRVVDAGVDDEQLEPGESTMASATVENTGEEAGEISLDLTVAGVVVDTVAVTVPAGETRTVSVEHRFGTPGIYPVSFGGADAGEVTVQAGNTTADRVLNSSIGAIVGVPLVVGLVLAIWRRKLFAAIRQRT